MTTALEQSANAAAAATAPAKKYTVKDTDVYIGDTRYQAGQTVELTDQQAARLTGLIELTKPAK